MDENKKQNSPFLQIEERVLAFWRENKIFEKSVARRQGKNRFVFYEGPPTANGAPGVHHVEARVFKDIVLRYKTMQGYWVPRRAGWDTHGLPVEIEVEKQLGLKSKKEIEAYGIAAFNKKCRESVWKYEELWEKMTERMGFWVDMEHAYVTYANEYIESLWWIIKRFANKGYLYEDYKVVPWCARCGTALSSHELAQGYETITDKAITVKFEILGSPTPKWGSDSHTKMYFLAWTTTPWTLLGNVALAVNPDAEYAFVQNGRPTSIGASDIFVVAKNLAEKFFPGSKILEAKKGNELIGLAYRPLYNDEERVRAYRVIAADFVSIEEGTGIVHIAPAFGEDDFQIGKKNNLPVLVTTDERGAMQTLGYPWDGHFFKDANALIVNNLKDRELLFQTEAYEHDYPFCWRCKTPLMYFARKTWWVAVNAVRKELLANNETINWHPEYLKHGRFGGWLKEEKDWAFSRERYWGTPLPVWRCEACNQWDAIGSLQELNERSKPQSNRYIIMRHGEAENNTKNIINCSLLKNNYSLTEKGRKQVEGSIKRMVADNIKPDIVFVSPFLRTQETAKMVSKAFGISASDIQTEPRIGEINTGIFDGKRNEEYHAFYASLIDKFRNPTPHGESLRNVAQRMFAALEEIEERYVGKTILIVSHEYPLWALWIAAHAVSDADAVLEKERRGDDFLSTAAFEELVLWQLPRDEAGNLDLHRPYIDKTHILCKSCGGAMRRVPEVVDVWFDSGSMPFAQEHFPFGTIEDLGELPYPADYIVEAVDQTRGWFYNLLAVGTLFGLGAPYRNVISLGHVLDAEGKKMSKSLGNVVDPMMLLGKYGADAVRWYFFTINQPWDEKRFSEKDIADASRRFLMILWNCYQFFDMYQRIEIKSRKSKVKNLNYKPRTINYKLVINKWIFARLDELIASVTQKMDSYDVVSAAREIEQFVVEDLSRWYIRRIRDVMKRAPGDSERQEIEEALRVVLLEASKLLAPFTPFIAEELYQQLRELAPSNTQTNADISSVHWEDWPDNKSKIIPSSDGIPSRMTGQKLLEEMKEARRIVSLAFEQRAAAGIKVRQPLQKLKIRDQKLKSADEQLIGLIKNEANIKEIVFDASLEGDVALDLIITLELKEEGMLRDIIRDIQAARKNAGLKPGAIVNMIIIAPGDRVSIMEKYRDTITHDVGARTITTALGDLLMIKFVP